MNIKQGLLGAILVFHCASHAAENPDNGQSFMHIVKTAAPWCGVAGAVAATGAGIYTLWKKYWVLNDVDFTVQANKDCQYMRGSYSSPVRAIAHLFGAELNNDYDSFFEQLTEEHLDLCAKQVTEIKRLSYYADLNKVRRLITDAETRDAKLEKSAPSTERDEQRKALKTLQTNLRELETLLVFAVEFIEAHGAYFNYQQQLYDLSARYEEELKIANINAKHLKAIVLKKALNWEWEYPYMDYAKKLMANLTFLKENKTYTNKVYPRLHEKISRVEAQLNAVLNMVLADQQYSDDAKQAQADKHDKEIAALKTKVESLRQEVRDKDFKILRQAAQLATCRCAQNQQHNHHQQQQNPPPYNPDYQQPDQVYAAPIYA